MTPLSCFEAYMAHQECLSVLSFVYANDMVRSNNIVFDRKISF